MADFDPDNITKQDMKNLADGIEGYLFVLKEIMVFPKEIQKEISKPMKESIKVVEELVKRLRKGDKNVFKSEDEWTSLIS